MYCGVHRYTRQQEYNPNRRFLRPAPLLPFGARAATIGAGGSSRLVDLRSLAAQQQQPRWSARAAQIKMIQPILVSIENKWVTKGGWIILIQPPVFRGAAPYRRVDLALTAFGISATAPTEAIMGGGMIEVSTISIMARIVRFPAS